MLSSFKRSLVRMGQISEKEKIEITLEALRRRGFDARFAENREVARKIVLDMVPQDWIVGCGDSATIRSIGVLQDLADLGNRVLNPFFKPKIMREKPQPTPLRVFKQTVMDCDVFLASSNAVTLDGKIVNIDGGGNRVAGMIFGPLRTILVVGRNKIVKDVHEALHRIKNEIAPVHSKTTGLPLGMLCAAAGKCVEPETFCGPGVRACNIIVILEGKPADVWREIVVILVDEDLGLGWDPAWPQERKDKIYAEYKEFTPPHRPIT
jgi:hypothetical protein